MAGQCTWTHTQGGDFICAWLSVRHWFGMRDWLHQVMGRSDLAALTVPAINKILLSVYGETIKDYKLIII